MFNEADHKRVSKGNSEGGQFTNMDATNAIKEAASDVGLKNSDSSVTKTLNNIATSFEQEIESKDFLHALKDSIGKEFTATTVGVSSYFMVSLDKQIRVSNHPNVHGSDSGVNMLSLVISESFEADNSYDRVQEHVFVPEGNNVHFYYDNVWDVLKKFLKE